MEKQLSILNALGKDYMNMCLVNIKTKKVTIIDLHGKEMLADIESENIKGIPYDVMCRKSIEKYVEEQKRPGISDAVSMEYVLQMLSEQQQYSFIYSVVKDGKPGICQIKYMRVDIPDHILMGFRMVDEVIAKEKENHIQKDQSIIRRTAEELRKERMFLDVLCRDYASVYYFDLKANTLEVLKIDPSANSAVLFGTELRRKFNYMEEMQLYCGTYIIDAEKENFLKTMDKENIRRKLQQSDRFVYRFQCLPDGDGHQRFEMQALRIDRESFDDTAILAFRYIDDIVSEEQKYQHKLEEALKQERISNEVLMAISKVYYAIFRIDLKEDFYEEIASDSKVHHLTGKQGKASTEMVELCKSFVVPEYQERIMQFFDIHTLADRLRHEETIAEEYLAKDGNWHTARFIVKRRDEKGEVTHVLYVTRLISDEKRREENWIAIAEAAQKANQSKTDFLRHMSHDIRTPINGILGMIAIADRHKDDVKKLQECREKVLGAMEYLLSLVNNVLDIGKLETSEIILEHKPFDLIPLLMKQLPVIEMQASDNGIKFFGGQEMNQIKHRYLIGSPVHLNRILMNLASNAIRYNRKGGSVTLYCKEVSSDENQAVYQFVCEDTGLGMSETFQANAFEPFSQDGKKSLSTYKGSGLGLSIVKKIVEQMHGTIDMQSKENVGTKFVITIPFDIDHEGQAHADGQYKPIHIDVSGQKALLVEDNELNREIAKMVLEDEGLVVDMAENGQEAVDAFANSKPGTYQFIFMDIMMPVMDGLEATRRIRAMDRPDAKKVPILAMTANAFQDDIQLSMDAGMNAHLTKPLDVEKIKQAIQEVAS